MNELSLHKWNPLTNVLELMANIRENIVLHGHAEIANNDPANVSDMRSPLGMYAFTCMFLDCLDAVLASAGLPG